MIHSVVKTEERYVHVEFHYVIGKDVLSHVYKYHNLVTLSSSDDPVEVRNIWIGIALKRFIEALSSVGIDYFSVKFQICNVRTYMLDDPNTALGFEVF